MTPRLAASLTTIVGLSMLAGWLSAFRNRAYLGWLGLAFMSMSGYLLAYDRAQSARAFNLPIDSAILAQKVCLVIAVLAFFLSLIAAARETVRRVREIQASNREAEEAMLEMMKASLEHEARAEQEASPKDDAPPPKGEG